MALIVVMLFMRVYAIWQSNKILVGLSGAVLLVSLRRYIFKDVRSFIAINNRSPSVLYSLLQNWMR